MKKRIKEESMTINDRIREDYGTLTHFCRKNGINITTLKVVLSGHGTSKPLAKKLKKMGYIKNIDELRKIRQAVLERKAV